MTMLIGADSWAPVTQQMLDALKKLDGFGFFGGYVGGADLFQNTPWPKAAWELLLTNGVAPLPIYVPKQDCSEDPLFVARDSVNSCISVGLHGVVAIDSEESMSRILNYQSWLDRVSSGINALGWRMVTYAGAHYVAQGSFPWQVVWGQHEDVPTHAEALQYGPYILTDASGNQIARIDGDSADSEFPFASFATPVIPPNIKEQLGMNISIGVNPKTGNLIVVGAAADNGNLLVFEQEKVSTDPNSWSVTDVTLNIGTSSRRYALS